MRAFVFTAGLLVSGVDTGWEISCFIDAGAGSFYAARCRGSFWGLRCWPEAILQFTTHPNWARTSRRFSCLRASEWGLARSGAWFVTMALLIYLLNVEFMVGALDLVLVLAGRSYVMR